MTRIVVDIETASLVDLKTAGADAYAEDSSTLVLCAGWRCDDGRAGMWLPGEKVPEVFFDPATIIVAHNAAFEIAIWRHKFECLGWPPLPALERWSCTMSRAQYHGLPAALEQVAEALRLPPHLQKDMAGHRLMLQMSRPRSLEPLTWWHETDPEKYLALQRYCRRDVEVESKLDNILPELPSTEAALWRLNQLMNTRGVRLDGELIGRLGVIVTSETRRLNQAMANATGGRLRSAGQVEALKRFLAEEHGLSFETLSKDPLTEILADPTLAPGPARVLRIRAEAAKTSTAKLRAMTRAVSGDGRARGCFRYYGAGRTGRYSSQRIQLQNLARPTIAKPIRAIDLIQCHGADGRVLDLLFEDTPLGVISSCLRGCLVPEKGAAFVVGDLAQIEARVIAWLAGQHDILGVFARGDDVYIWTAEKVGSSNRQLGKVLVLSCGFGTGPPKFLATAAKYGVTLELPEAEHLVWEWREANHHIVDYWHALGHAALDIVGAPSGISTRVGRVLLEHRNRALVIRLPSGRELFYQRAAVERDEEGRFGVTYEGVNQYTRHWERIRTWGGKLAENITQAVARDVLAHDLVKLYGEGLPIVGTVHDELIGEPEAADAQPWLERMLDVMQTAPAWAPGLPIGAEGHILERYGKA